MTATERTVEAAMSVFGQVVAERCTLCDGAGDVANPAWDEAYDMPDDDDRAEALAALVRRDEPEAWGCGECDATGWVLTAAGSELRRFVKRFAS